MSKKAKKPWHRDYNPTLDAITTSERTEGALASDSCPCCGHKGQYLNHRSKDYNCINPHCDVRTFRKRRLHLTLNDRIEPPASKS